ncbi:PilZ domain-containing protein [Vibrio quintilis]|uniref:PilZ domain protein n=1 Tax=Vibrio quintilis TaxID=1117707 RepID=A0A1M7Z0T5_9VIBR|nr:PilZ domain-containing protein [Vibrio quintilis]SHO58442.1 PilZ domain protein [Vibrio quintilis]
MQQSEILSLAEKLIPIYNTEEFEQILSQITKGQPPSVKLLVKMELNKKMAPCSKPVDLRGRVQGECREYILDGLTHWLDDVAFNDYHKNVNKFGRYTEGVWEALYNTRNNFRVMGENQNSAKEDLTTENNPFLVEIIDLGYDLLRQENRLKLSSQAEIKLANGQLVNALTVDLSPSGAKLKVPAAFDYKLGEVIHVRYTDLDKKTEIQGLFQPIEYRLIGVDESFENDAVKYLRIKKLTDTDLIEYVIEEQLKNEKQKLRHDNQDKIIRARTRAYEHMFLKHACQLPVFFSKDELKVVLLTESNHDIWHYWHDERNQQTLSNLFTAQRMRLLTKSGVSESSNTIYAFKHTHQEKTLFFSMMKPEANPQLRKLFWHLGAKKESWRAFRFSIFELSESERKTLSTKSPELTKHLSSLTHCGILQEISNTDSAKDYLYSEQPNLPGTELNQFRHPRKASHSPISIFFDARTQRKEPRYQLNSPLEMKLEDNTIIKGNTIDLSKRGLSLLLEKPTKLKVGDQVTIDYLELKLYDNKLPLAHVSYNIVRVAPNGQHIQLVIEENSHTVRIIAFFNKLIENNQDRLTESLEVLPSITLLENLHHILLNRVVCAPVFVERQGANMRAAAIGISEPPTAYLTLLAKLGRENLLSLEPILKGHTNTLLATPMRHIDGATPQYFDIYLSVKKFGSQIQSLESRLITDFSGLKERTSFIQDAQVLGEIFVLRFCAIPVFHPMSTLLRQDLDDLAAINLYHTKNIEKSIASLVGYAEIIDITDEVLNRLEINN